MEEATNFRLLFLFMTTKKTKENKKLIIKYIIIGLVLGIVIAIGYYFIDYQDTTNEFVIEEPVGVSKEKVLLADQQEYDLDIVLNSIISNQLVLQESIRVMNEQIELIKEQENATENNQSE